MCIRWLNDLSIVHTCLGDLQQHLQTMFTLLRPEDNIRLVNDTKENILVADHITV